MQFSQLFLEPSNLHSQGLELAIIPFGPLTLSREFGDASSRIGKIPRHAFNFQPQLFEDSIDLRNLFLLFAQIGFQLPLLGLERLELLFELVAIHFGFVYLFCSRFCNQLG